jgi:hypothetical protein
LPATVWIKPLGAAWEAVGPSRSGGVWHEDLQLVSDQWGPKSGTFTLRRQMRAMFPDLLADTPVFAETGGVRVWAGRIKETPEQSGAAREISVALEGAQYHLDDRAFERVYVHTKLSDWKDIRSFLGADLTKSKVAGQVSSDGGISIGWPKGTVNAVGDDVGVMLDLGPSTVAKRIVFTCAPAVVSGNALLQLTTFDASDFVTGRVDLSNSGMTAGTPFTVAVTSVGKRYICIRLQEQVAQTLGADMSVKITDIKVFADTAYESGNASILTADIGIKDALTRGTLLLDPDRRLIGTPGFSFPDFAPPQPRTTREYVAAFNAPSNWQFKIDEYWRPVYRARPTIPLIEIGAWLGAEADSGSSNSAEGITTEAIVRGQGPDGAPISVTRSQTGTIVDRQSGVRTKTLDTSFRLNTALANALGDAHLDAHRVSPFKGQVIITIGGARRLPTGLPLHPSRLLLMTGELLRMSGRVDPDTGGISRAITLDQVTYKDSDQAATVDLDNTRNDFEALNERLGLLVPS